VRRGRGRGFRDGCVGQADGVEVILVGLDAGAIDFHLNDIGVDAIDRGAESLVKHRGVRDLVPGSAHEGLIRGISTVCARAAGAL